MGLVVATTKISNHIGGLALQLKGKHYPCDSVMASMFLGNDDHTSAYVIAGCRMKRGEYHLFDEMIGRLSPSFISRMKDFLRSNKVERVILLCSDEDLRNRMRKEIGIEKRNFVQYYFPFRTRAAAAAVHPENMPIHAALRG